MNLSSGRDGQQKLCSSLLKLYREGFPEDAIYQEYRMSQLVYSLGIKTAQPYEVISRGKRLGIVYDYVHGRRC
ncbi:aminoglycoside phosphotransferase [Paenibacillus dendritiformis C454]|uniref:Aminoglycoside phosphotransferase n=2 Tax=Paenibacillus dendritiformis TaxID=130049 RepID=H3SGV8_9BACL|nr:aminoglycoside phosphotransferase [Paenibacillus dendritiformis C454]